MKISIYPFLIAAVLVGISTRAQSAGCRPEEINLISAKAKLNTFLGRSAGDYVPIRGGSVCVRDFEHGRIYAFQNTASMIYGLIKQKYDQVGADRSFLGLPTSDELDTTDKNGRYNTFEFGLVYWHSQRGTFEIHGDIYQKWRNLGGRASLGWPLTDESSTPDRIGRYNQFQNGSVYWHPCAGAFEIHGLIRDYWTKHGSEQGYLGYPLSDETPAADGKGRFNRFQRGYVFWHPSLGTYQVSHQFWLLWNQAGGVKGKYGYPLADAACDPLRCTQRFEHGNIIVSRNHDGIDLRNEIAGRGIKIRNQGPRGTCSMLSMTFLLEYAYTQMCGDSGNHLSAEYLNHESNKVAGNAVDGEFFSNAAEAYNRYGIIDDGRLPYAFNLRYDYDAMEKTVQGKKLEAIGADIKSRMTFVGRFIKAIDGTVGLNDAQFEAVLSYLDAAMPVAIGRAHSMVIVGYEKSAAFPGGGRFIFRNSYGEETGIRGYQYEDFKSVKSTTNDAYVYIISGLK